MSDDKSIETLERRSKRVFDDSVAALDAATRSRLNQTRQKALAEITPARTQGWRWPLVPVGTLAAAALVALLVVRQGPPATDTGLQASSLGDLEILLAEEDIEMLDEDLEFYGWLEEQPEFANATDGVG
jgi:hypothetical protein